jgi:hypothetical protein
MINKIMDPQDLPFTAQSMNLSQLFTQVNRLSVGILYMYVGFK